MSKFNDKGEEIMDPTPIAVPLRFKQRSYYDQMREMIRREMSQAAQDRGLESFEEADDFDIGDDYDPTTPYEEQFDPDDGVSNFDRQFVQEKPIDQSKPKEGDGDLDPHDGQQPSKDKKKVDPDPDAQ